MKTEELIKRLRERKAIALNGASALVLDQPDRDCAEAADTLERIVKAWEEYASYNGADETHMQALRKAITGE